MVCADSPSPWCRYFTVRGIPTVISAGRVVVDIIDDSDDPAAILEFDHAGAIGVLAAIPPDLHRCWNDADAGKRGQPSLTAVLDPLQLGAVALGAQWPRRDIS